MTEGQSLYRIDEHDGYAALSFSPQMSDAQMSTVDSVGADVLRQIDRMPSPRLIVDLSSLRYMGSAMVALVVRVWKAVSARDGRMVVVNDNEMVQEVLRIAGLEQVWTVVPNRSQAVEQLGVRRRAGTGGSSLGIVLLVLGVVALAAAVAGLILLLGEAQAMTARQAFILTTVSAALGLIVSGIAAYREAGRQRIIAGVLAAVSLVVLVIGLVRSPVPLNGAAPPEADAIPTQE